MVGDVRVGVGGEEIVVEILGGAVVEGEVEGVVEGVVDEVVEDVVDGAVAGFVEGIVDGAEVVLPLAGFELDAAVMDSLIPG